MNLSTLLNVIVTEVLCLEICQTREFALPTFFVGNYQVQEKSYGVILRSLTVGNKAVMLKHLIKAVLLSIYRLCLTNFSFITH